MSYDEKQLKKIIQELVNNKVTANLLFGLLESQYQGRLKELKKTQEMLDLKVVKKRVEAEPEIKPIYQINQKLTDMYEWLNKEFQLIHYILEAILQKTVDLPTAHTTIDRQSMISEEDRGVLDWLKQYMQHEPGEEDNLL